MDKHWYRRIAVSSLATALTLVALALVFGKPHGLVAVLYGLTGGLVGRFAHPVLLRCQLPWTARGCLGVRLGPPWRLKPRFERSKYHARWSLVWLYWGFVISRSEQTN